MATVSIAPPRAAPLHRERTLAPPRLTFRRRHQALWRFLHHRTGLAGGGLVLLVSAGSILAPWIAPRDPISQNLLARLVGVGEQGYVLGSDAFGRDMLSRLLWGGQTSLVI